MNVVVDTIKGVALYYAAYYLHQVLTVVALC